MPGLRKKKYQQLNITRKVNKQSRAGFDGAKPGETEGKAGEGRGGEEGVGDCRG